MVYFLKANLWNSTIQNKGLGLTRKIMNIKERVQKLYSNENWNYLLDLIFKLELFSKIN